MQLTSKDMRALRIPAVALVAAVIASYAMVSLSSGHYEQARKQQRDELNALQDARTRYQRSGDERETITHYLQAYRQLEKTGFVGSEQRLTWVESLRAANTRAGLFGVDYQLSAQEPYPYVAKENPIGSRVRRSRMRLSFGVLHEGDLARLLQ